MSEPPLFICPQPTQVHLAGEGKEAIETGRNRLLVGFGLFAVAFLAVALRLIDVTVMGSEDARRIARTDHGPAPAVERGDIVDRNGVLLATSLPTASFYADPSGVIDAAEAARRLVRVLPGLDEAELVTRLSASGRFVWIQRHLTPRQQYKVNHLGIPGLHFQRSEKRFYPQGRLAAHVLGTVDVDNVGIAGVEKTLDAHLRRPASLGLSLDARVQHVLADEIARAMKKFKAIGAAGLIMDAETCEVLAMVSLPDFEPDRTGSADDVALFNRATLGVYEMGSTFKLFNVAMALDSGSVTLKSRFDATKPIRVSRHLIRDYKPKNRWLSVPEVLLYSSNIGSAKMALEVGTARQRAFLKRLGMIEAAGIELPEVGKPLSPSPWREINTMTVAFGYGIAVSPLQLASGVAALVNGGILRPATLLKRRADAAPAGSRVIRPKTSRTMRRLMRLVVARGTGRKAEVPGYFVGGKTGTAEKQGGRGYRRKELLSSFIAAFPMQAPRYVVLALFDEPKGRPETYGYATGGWVAAPVIRAIVARVAPMLGLAPADVDAPEVLDALEIDVPKAPRRPGRVADHRLEAGTKLASF